MNPLNGGVQTSHGLAGLIIAMVALVVIFYVIGFRFAFTVGAGIGR